MKIPSWTVNIMDKQYYIKQISNKSDKYGDKLIEMMCLYGKSNLQEITFEEAKEFYEKLNKNIDKREVL